MRIERNGTIKFDETDLAAIAEFAGDGCDAELAREYIEAEWDNADEHQQWLESATLKEIGEWVAACRK